MKRIVEVEEVKGIWVDRSFSGRKGFERRM